MSPFHPLAPRPTAFIIAPLASTSRRPSRTSRPSSPAARPHQPSKRRVPRPSKRARKSVHTSRTAASIAANKWSRVDPSLRNEVSHPSDLRPESCPALVLNADFSPLSYMPLSLWPWQDAIKAVFLDRVTVVATYDIGVRSPGMIFPLPSVISLKQYQPRARKRPAFSRFNVFMRDAFSCQYCGRRFPTQELTFDHVIPRCAGGKTNWQNVVTACIGCNHSKGRYLLHELKHMKLLRMPHEPTNGQLQARARLFPPRYLHESWRDYVYWSQSMKVESDQ
ncbi:unnamed protein product [Chondrus crispus]|uniref:HNH nuclease domain-containing protein n=1 Tax=Chondrus crispus TaxID=2769 RepID=R7QKE3_CHOCR|nr:unnamed protein product [Chondrus crispus]CDF38248.1 unnamed protein product [Chondrus crispus]|eukprot:XP_005718133.1 unnamed protein product [Chondrus crispus]